MKYFNLFAMAALLVGSVAFSSCSKDNGEDEPESGFSSYIKTSGAEDVDASSATIVGQISVDKLMDVNYTMGAVYSCVVSSSKDLVAGKNGVENTVTNALVDNRFYVDAKGLESDTKYSFRAYIKVRDQYYYGKIMSFTTLKADPVNPNAGKPVDLGLPSGTKWADCDLIKDTQANNAFAYGWTTPTIYPGSYEDTWSGYTFAALKAQGVIDANGNLTPEHDAARQMWGGKWRIPTADECRELIDPNNCNVVHVSAYTYKFVSRTNGNSITIGSHGLMMHNETWKLDGETAYWSATYDKNEENRAFCLSWMQSTYVHWEPAVSSYRGAGYGWVIGFISNALPIRPVCD